MATVAHITLAPKMTKSQNNKRAITFERTEIIKFCRGRKSFRMMCSTSLQSYKSLRQKKLFYPIISWGERMIKMLGMKSESHIEAYNC